MPPARILRAGDELPAIRQDVRAAARWTNTYSRELSVLFQKFASMIPPFVLSESKGERRKIPPFDKLRANGGCSMTF